jgi:hypothetical protein
VDRIHPEWVRDRLCEDGNEHSSSIKYREILKFLVELPSSAQRLSPLEVFSKFGDWLRYGSSAICNKF